MIVCKECGEEKPKCCKGMCKICYDRKWREEKPDYYRKWRRENLDRAREIGRLHYYKYQDRYKEYGRTRYIEHRESSKEYQPRLQVNSLVSRKERERQKWQRRRSRMNNLPATLTTQDWQEILDCWDYRCAYCGKHAFELDQEHVTPVCQGGGYTIENIVPACKSCNSKKGGRTPIEAGMSFYYQR